MKVLIIGRWGKTHALAKALSKSKNVELYSLMDKKNTGIADVSDHYEIMDITDRASVDQFVTEHGIELVFIVPELALEKDMTTYFNKKGVPAIGPSAAGTKLEGDKSFLRDLMREYKIEASPEYHVFFDVGKAREFVKNCDYPVAVKPAGVTEGDGVKVMGIQLKDKNDALNYIKEIFDRSIGDKPCVIIEKKMEGEEYTLQVFSDGKTIIPMPVVRDYKLLEEGDSGLNTPGMGSYSSPDHLLPFLSKENFEESMDILRKILNAMKEKHDDKFKGILSGQFMLTEDGVKLVEINVRPGDSEILNITPILKTDLLEICIAIMEEKLDEIRIEFEHQATVCKYRVPEGFPTPEGLIELDIDRKRIDEIGGHLFQSSFEVERNLYQPSPRLFAVTGTGDTLAEAYEICEEGLSCIKGENIFHRKDIGSQELTEKFKKHSFIKEIPEGEPADDLV